MDVTVENVLNAIKEINDRRAKNFVIISIKQNTPIGLDSLSFFMGVTQETLEPVLRQMVLYELIEFLPVKRHVNGGQKQVRKLKLKE